MISKNQNFKIFCVATVGVTDADLLEISNRIGALDFNNVGSEIVMDPQGKTSGCTSDVAPNP
jgi:hypothetical protein